MKDSIRLHEKFGLNPTMPICIICKEETGEIALLGAGYKGEAPARMIVGIEPCAKCREKYLSQGVLMVECEVEYGYGDKKKYTPTGTLAVIKDEAFQNLFGEVPKGKIAQVEVGLLKKINAV